MSDGKPTNIRPIRGGGTSHPPETLAEALEQFAARCAAVAPQCVLLALQCGDEAPEIFAFPPAKSVKLGMLHEIGDVLEPSPFVETEE